MRLLIVLVAALLGGCFDPTLRDGVVACGTGGACPSGLSCSATDGLCYADPPRPTIDGAVDGAPGDAAALDAPQASDGPPGADAPPADAPPPAADAAMTECNDGVDNDCDGLFDILDPGCTGPADLSEHGTKECDDGLDNDLDTAIDFKVVGPGCPIAGDPQCISAMDAKEDM